MFDPPQFEVDFSRSQHSKFHTKPISTLGTFCRCGLVEPTGSWMRLSGEWVGGVGEGSVKTALLEV